ncbi:hypothetical protein BG015_008178 [Linnemannia schmuckeri]|uniref:Uncharacterized protein n=1 Tax=Linnemannia schmuckeri TaxID=64567 RepID=A0A9P5RXP7_9FUNG|nr:hypothetical protein BG015_008178 [Linnemannia schmuckeri]
MIQAPDMVTMETSDKTMHHGDILVGTVRQWLYERLMKEGKLSELDQEDSLYGCVMAVMQDAVAHANLIYALPSNSAEDIQ